MYPSARLANITLVASSSIALAVLIGCPAAYVFARRRLDWMRIAFFCVLVTRFFPVISLAVPLHLLFTELHLRDTGRGLILAYTSLSLPFVIRMMDAFFQDSPWELQEAARVVGCSRSSALIQIALPLSAHSW